MKCCHTTKYPLCFGKFVSGGEDGGKKHLQGLLTAIKNWLFFQKYSTFATFLFQSDILFVNNSPRLYALKKTRNQAMMHSPWHSKTKR
jgi:hypothetical protein